MPYVEVHVELADLDIDDLVEFLQSRDYSVMKTGEPKTNEHFAEKMFDEFRDKNPPPVVREFVYEHAGRIL